MVENKLEIYIDSSISRSENDIALWIQKNAETQTFLIRNLELDELKHLLDNFIAAQIWQDCVLYRLRKVINWYKYFWINL